jgi:hypothetical protein
MKQRDDALTEIAVLDKWRMALKSLTPQGSDDGEPLCETPEECVKYILELKRQLMVLKRNAEWRDE